MTRLCMEERVDIIIISHNLASEQAEPFFAAIRAHNDRHTVPVCVVLAAQLQALAEACLPGGSYQYFPEPADIDVLLTTMTACLDNVAENTLPILEGN